MIHNVHNIILRLLNKNDDMFERKLHTVCRKCL